MDQYEAKRIATNQFIAVFLVVFGSFATFMGCYFHFSEMTTAAVGVIGMGGGMLTNSPSNTLNNKQGGNVNLLAPADGAH